MNHIVEILATVFFLVGAVGNCVDLYILYKTARRRNRKHVLLLRFLAVNDLMAQLGMLLLIHLKNDVLPEYWSCVGFVLIRAFGLGSGCVALVMALDRWFALTRPFCYHKVVSYKILKRFLFCLWLTAVTLTYLPLFGFGLYYDPDAAPEKEICSRFRYAVEVKDIVYAFLFFGFGMTLCICIAVFNSAVIWELLRIRSQGKLLVRRVSRSIINNGMGCSRYQTPEEEAFANLMAIICVIFLGCWIPQLVAVPIAQFLPQTQATVTFTKIADVLLVVYFTLNPFVYVLRNYIERRFVLPSCFFKRSTNSLHTTTTTVETPTSVLLNPQPFHISINK
ncbi:hypothetical protein NQ315_014980 [Exocentrus adspersus]|uniref:G-protein coupled receptors family 1 profile domain-containing protein n=1 Tax=Exocentrus adspersus TaxID=1586481 RepID=A0AAV8VWA8_9CUCU|nr:hypothetical protein NQ315_014980 [Exocentrus adspersus]